MKLYINNPFNDTIAVFIHADHYFYTVSYKWLNKESAFPCPGNALSLFSIKPENVNSTLYLN